MSKPPKLSPRMVECLRDAAKGDLFRSLGNTGHFGWGHDSWKSPAWSLQATVVALVRRGLLAFTSQQEIRVSLTPAGRQALEEIDNAGTN